MHQSPAESILISKGIAPILKDNAATNTEVIDMQGWDGCLFVLFLGTTDTTADMAISMDTATAFSSATAITGAEITQIGGTGDGFHALIDVYRPTERYLRGTVTVGDGTTGGLISVLTMRYRRTGRTPITQDAFELVKVVESDA